MKKQFTKALAAIVLLASGFTATANESEREISFTTEDEKAVVLQMKNIEVGTQISLVNEEGTILYRDKATGSDYDRSFKLDELNENELYLEIESAQRLEVMAVEVSDNQVFIKKEPELVIEKPIVKLADQQMKVYFGDSDTTYKMKIYDKQGSVVFKDKIGSASMERYDVTGLDGGQYQIQFMTKGRSFNHTIKL